MNIIDIIDDYIDCRKLATFNVTVSKRLESSDDLEANEIYASEVEELLKFVREASTGGLIHI